VAKNPPAKDKYPRPIAVETVRVIGTAISKVLWRIKFHNTENIPQNLKGGLLIAPNHQTYFDPIWVYLPIKRRLRFMAWDKAFEWVLVGRFIRYFGAFPVSLERVGVVKALKKAREVLRNGDTLVVFPEGSREFSDGRLLPFKTGAAKIAVDAGVPILPVTIRGANRVWSQDHKLPRLGKVEIFYHPILETEQRDEAKSAKTHLEDLTSELESTIASKMRKLS